MKRTQWVIVLLFAVIFGMAVYFRGPLARQFGLNQSSIVAELNQVEGDVRLQRMGEVRIDKASDGDTLLSGDRVMTQTGAHARLILTNGYDVRLLPDSHVVIERDDSRIPPRTSLTFLSGNYELLKVGEGAGEVVAIIGESVRELNADRAATQPIKIEGSGADAAAAATPSPTTVEPQSPAPTAADASSGITPMVDLSQSLPDDYIESIIRAQRGYLSRCFAEFLQTKPQAQGRMDVSFTIEPKGNVSRAKVLGSTVGDEKFQKCVIGVIERLQFRSFKSSPIVVNYPLQFD